MYNQSVISYCVASACAVSLQPVFYLVPFSSHLFLLCVFSQSVICLLLASRNLCFLLVAGCTNGEMWNDFDVEARHTVLYCTGACLIQCVIASSVSCHLSLVIHDFVLCKFPSSRRVAASVLVPFRSRGPSATRWFKRAV